MSSPIHQQSTDAAAATITATATATQTNPIQPESAHTAAVHETENEELTVDNDYDSAYGDSSASDTTSIASMYKGYFENGRRYQNVKAEEYFLPTDDKQWESMSKGHMLMRIMDWKQPNSLFRSPISSDAQRVLDLGTGSGEWALDCADRFPHLTVHGVDLTAPPQTWTAPNCIFEVDDMSKPWTWNHKFDLVHMRHMLGSFDDTGFNQMYKRIYDNLSPGGWIEQVEWDVGMFCDDDTFPPDSILHYRDLFMRCAQAAGKPVDTMETMRGRIEAAGFTNIHQQDYKIPVGTWPSQPVHKDAGRLAKQHFLTGVEGWCMFLFTRFGQPTPWTVEEVQVYLAKVRNELNAGYHVYQKGRRVWAQKPLESAKKQQKVEVENVAQGSPSPEQPAKKQKTGGVESEEAKS